MTLGLVGRKVGMTRIFAEDGSAIPVTVLDVSNNRVTQIKNPETDGYAAVQVTFGKRRASRVNKAAAGHLARAGVEAGHVLREFRVAGDQLASLKPGDTVSVTIFSVGQKVDVSGTTIGKGFTGAITRHHFSSNRAFPGKRMAGHLGDVSATAQSLEVVRVDEARQLLLVKGAVPGARGGDVVVRPAVKAGN